MPQAKPAEAAQHKSLLLRRKRLNGLNDQLRRLRNTVETMAEHIELTEQDLLEEERQTIPMEICYKWEGDTLEFEADRQIIKMGSPNVYKQSETFQYSESISTAIAAAFLRTEQSWKASKVEVHFRTIRITYYLTGNSRHAITEEAMSFLNQLFQQYEYALPKYEDVEIRPQS